MKPMVITSFPDTEIRERWLAFLDEADMPTCYTSPNYFTDPYVSGKRFAVAAVDNAGEFHAVLTGVTGGTRTVSGLFSRPQIAFRTGSDVAIAAKTLTEGMEAASPSASLIELYSWQKIATVGMSESPSGDATSVVMLDLSKGSDAIFAGFSQTRRNELRKAERQNLLEIKDIETEAELAEMYEIHCDWNRLKGHEPNTFERMRIAVGQRENRRVLIAKADGRVVAGSFYRFVAGGVVEYAANFSRPEHRWLRPNDVLGWHAIQWACESGFTHFSMGGSHLFLRRFGGEIITTYRYRRDKSFLKKHELRERVVSIGVGVYRRLPQGLRSRLSGLMAK
ncbi:MAG: GNAT family N-acetyltransferase [Acidobacteria bacterium]|nr:GNAT family N-acetyltransferase [Acidobacteriota bacterium]